MELPSHLPLILDGATATNLMKKGMTIEDCPEKWILEHPEKYCELAEAYVKAGSQIIYAPTFSANPERLKRFGLEKQTKEINTKLVELAKKSSGDALVAGNISSTGMLLEPYEDISRFDIYYTYLEQAEALAEAGVDLFAIETMTSITEARYAVLACKRFDLPIFITFSSDEDGMLADGSSVLSALICLQEMGINAFGFNCMNIEDMTEVLKIIFPYAKVPVIAKPYASISDESSSYRLSSDEMSRQITALLENGAEILGGCCGTSPKHIAKLKKTVEEFDFSRLRLDKYDDEEQLVLANYLQPFFITADNLEYSQSLECSNDMSDELLELNDTNTDAIMIELFSYDDAVMFSENAHMATLPVIFHSESRIALDTALFLYDGRAMIDKNCEIEEYVLEDLAQRYGAILY